MTGAAGVGDSAKVAAARLFAVARYPYLAAAVFASDLHWAPWSSTVAVDRSWRLHADPEVVATMEVQDLGRLIAHLTGHLLRDHAGRAGRADQGGPAEPGAWNVAADAEVNDDLEADDMVPPVAPATPSSFGGEPGGLAETYLPALRGAVRRWDCGSGCDGRERPSDGRPGRPGLSDRDIGLLKLAVVTAARQQERSDPGSVAGGWLRWAEELLPSRVDWRRVLAAELRTGLHRTSGAVDYSYRRPARRAAAVPGIVLPTLERPVPEIAVICDTSGSMDDGQLGAALSEVEGLLTRTGITPDRLRVLSCDTALTTVQRVSRAAAVQLVGGGGTDMGEGVAAASRLHPAPDVIIVLTDGMTPWPDRPPPGARVIVGLIDGANRHDRFAWPVPHWARAVHIPDGAA